MLTTLILNLAKVTVFVHCESTNSNLPSKCKRVVQDCIPLGDCMHRGCLPTGGVCLLGVSAGGVFPGLCVWGGVAVCCGR